MHLCKPIDYILIFRSRMKMTSMLPTKALEGDILVLGGAMAALEEDTVDMEAL